MPGAGADGAMWEMSMWAMSTDYAALTASIIVAVLVIGTVQFHSLMKIAFDRAAGNHEAWAAHLNEIHQRVQAGDLPRPDEVHVPRGKLEAAGFSRAPMAIIVGGVAWFTCCALLVTCEILIVFWSADPHPGRSPGLAGFTFFVTAIAIVATFVEAVIRASLSVFAYFKRVFALINEFPLSRETLEQDMALIRRSIEETLAASDPDSTHASGTPG